MILDAASKTFGAAAAYIAYTFHRPDLVSIVETIALGFAKTGFDLLRVLKDPPALPLIIDTALPFADGHSGSATIRSTGAAKSDAGAWLQARFKRQASIHGAYLAASWNSASTSSFLASSLGTLLQL